MPVLSQARSHMASIWERAAPSTMPVRSAALMVPRSISGGLESIFLWLIQVRCSWGRWSQALTQPTRWSYLPAQAISTTSAPILLGSSTLLWMLGLTGCCLVPTLSRMRPSRSPQAPASSIIILYTVHHLQPRRPRSVWSLAAASKILVRSALRPASLWVLVALFSTMGSSLERRWTASMPGLVGQLLIPVRAASAAAAPASFSALTGPSTMPTASSAQRVMALIWGPVVHSRT